MTLQGGDAGFDSGGALYLTPTAQPLLPKPAHHR